ncbi:MAG TPA: M23 family metallopeptidase [Sphingomicrobium sp.]|nr:M23 family metallopeptidase [Sphingomicrobium sp.]
MGKADRRPDRTGRKFAIVSTALVTAILTSAVWIIVYNIVSASDEQLTAAGGTVTVDRPGSPTVEIAEGLVVGPAGLAIPVAGVQVDELVDTFTQARAGGARRHDAIDIMAPEGTPVVAAAPGTIDRLFDSQGGGGTTIYIRSDDGLWSYYYAHLQRYAPGLKEGRRVERGQVIGYVGHTGNANPEGPHLHFAINRISPGDDWHSGEAINPYPLLAGQSTSG